MQETAYARNGVCKTGKILSVASTSVAYLYKGIVVVVVLVFATA
jgi:hypothetical protein